MRPIDHCVLPTADLDAARKRLTALGFTVAPDGIHPFGTANCCVSFADGTFLEPLAVADAKRAAAASRRGNVFTARDAAYRYRSGPEGFSALVFGTDDAAGDHRSFVRRGISAGRVLNFSRPFVDAAGQADKASFRLAFAADLRAPDAFFFTCQRVNAPAVDRTALQSHANGVRRIKRVILETREPEAFSDFMSAVSGSTARDESDGIRVVTDNGDVLVRRARSREPGLRLTGIVFGVGDVGKVASLLVAAGIRHRQEDGSVTVAAGAGQGSAFSFEALPER